MSAIVKSPTICSCRAVDVSRSSLAARCVSFYQTFCLCLRLLVRFLSPRCNRRFLLSLCGRTRRRLVRSHTDMPGKATPEYAQTGKPKQAFTPVQQRAVFEERIQLEVRGLPWGCWA